MGHHLTRVGVCANVAGKVGAYLDPLSRHRQSAALRGRHRGLAARAQARGGGPEWSRVELAQTLCLAPSRAAARLRELERRNLELAAEAAAKDDRIAELETEAAAKDSRIAELAGKAEDMDARIAELELLRAQEAEQAARLQARVHELVRELFGSKTEKHPPTKAKPKPKPLKKPEPPPADEPDSAPADEPEPAPADPPKRKRGRQPGAPTPPRIDRKHLPGQRLRLLPSERCCPTCGEPYVSNGTEKSELIEIVFEVLRRELARQRLRPRCTCPEASAPVAPPAPRLMQRTQLGVSVWTYLFVQVFALYRPQAAVVRDLTARGLRIGVGTVSQGLRRIGELFEPVLEAIVERQQEADWAHADETSWPVQDVEGDRGRRRCWLWICLTEDAVRLKVQPTRSAASGRELLGELGRNGKVKVVCDRYMVYKVLGRALPELVPSWCWVHQRRDFVRIKTGHPRLTDWVKEWLQRFGRVFQRAARRREAWDPERAADKQGAAFQQLQGALESAAEALFKAARKQRGEAFEKCQQAEAAHRGGDWARAEAQGAALHSLPEHREGLMVSILAPAVPLDNNVAERTLRGPVIARLTSFGSGSEAGAELVGRMFSIDCTLSLWGLNPYARTQDYLDDCARRGGRPPPDLDLWLPWNMDADRRQALGRPPPRPPLPPGAERPSPPTVP